MHPVRAEVAAGEAPLLEGRVRARGHVVMPRHRDEACPDQQEGLPQDPEPGPDRQRAQLEAQPGAERGVARQAGRRAPLEAAREANARRVREAAREANARRVREAAREANARRRPSRERPELRVGDPEAIDLFAHHRSARRRSAKQGWRLPTTFGRAVDRGRPDQRTSASGRPDRRPSDRRVPDRRIPDRRELGGEQIEGRQAVLELWRWGGAPCDRSGSPKGSTILPSSTG